MRTLQATRNEILLTAACDLIGASISHAEIVLQDQSSVPHWKTIVEVGLRHRNASVQESATKAFGAVSRLVDCSSDLARLIREFRVGLSPMQQSLGILVGELDYQAFPHGLENALTFILESVDRKVRTRALHCAPRLTGSPVTPLSAQHRGAEELLRITSPHACECAGPDPRP